MKCNQGKKIWNGSECVNVWRVAWLKEHNAMDNVGSRSVVVVRSVRNDLTSFVGFVEKSESQKQGKKKKRQKKNGNETDDE